MQQVVEFVGSRLEGFGQFVFVAIGYESYFVVFVDECLNGCRILFFVVGALECGNFFDDGLFGFQVGYLFRIFIAVVGGFLFEEVVAGGHEAFPDCIRLFFADGAYLFPLFLQLYHFVGGGFPIGAVFQGFGLFAQCFFGFQIFGKFCFRRFVECFFGFEEFVARIAETFEGFHSGFVRWNAADGFPFGLNFDDFLRFIVPLFVGFQGVGVYLFDEFAQRIFFGHELFFLFFDGFEIGLVAFVDGCRCGFEPIPNFFALFACHGADFAPIVVQFLQLFEGVDYIFAFGQAFGLFAQRTFLLEVFLEVVVAQVVVYFDEVVELLLICAVGFPNFGNFRCRHLSDGFPILLQFAEGGNHRRQIVRRGDEFGQFVEYALFGGEVFGLLCFDHSVFGGFQLAVFGHQFFECGFERIRLCVGFVGCGGFAVVGGGGIEFHLHFGFQLAIEALFDAFNLLFDCRYWSGVQQLAQFFHQLFACQVVECVGVLRHRIDDFGDDFAFVVAGCGLDGVVYFWLFHNVISPKFELNFWCQLPL